MSGVHNVKLINTPHQKSWSQIVDLRQFKTIFRIIYLKFGISSFGENLCLNEYCKCSI